MLVRSLSILLVVSSGNEVIHDTRIMVRDNEGTAEPCALKPKL